MPRKLIPLTEDLTNSESLMKFRNWEKNENFPAPSTGECEQKTQGEKVRALVSKWNRTKEKKVNDEKLDIFSTAKKAPKDFATIKPKEILEKVDGMDQASFKGPKLCKTVEEQKQLVAERERKAMENCQSWKGVKSEKDVANYDEGTNLSWQSLSGRLKPRTASRSVSFLAPNLPTTKLLELNQPDTGIIVNETEDEKSHRCNEFDFDPREEQQEIDGNRIKVYRCGEKLFAKLDENCENEEARKETLQKICNHRINLKNSKLNVFEPRRQQKSVMEMSLGKPYGIQLGALHIGDEFFDKDLRNKQALDVLLVAHGMSYNKAPVHWTQHDIDNILIVGTELYKQTREIQIDKLSRITKGFTYKKQFIQVTMSEPIVVGRVMTMSDRSIDLQLGLKKFFSQHRHGILITPEMEVYIRKKSAVYVFDPRGRTLNCERSSQGGAALMVLGNLKNAYHLLVNLSGINVKSPFKICAVTTTEVTNSSNTVEKFTAASGNSSKKCRSDDFKIVSKHAAFLQGSLHLGSKVFGRSGGKQHLTTAIMAMVYSKIDPPNSWSSAILDRVLHFGTKLYTDCIDGGPIRNVTLTDIPSKFYVGDVYRVGIAIVPFVQRVTIEKTRLFCDNVITKVLRNIFETLSLRCLLLQIGNFTYAVWQMMTTDVFYFFDAFQKDVNGKLDSYEGNSSLFMTDSIDKLCEIVVNRVVSTPRSETSMLNIHGMKILELVKLSKKEQKSKPKFKLMKMDCIKPISREEVEKLEDSPSTVDSIAPLLTEKELLTLREKPLEKPLHRKITNLNSPSLVCCKVNLYDDIMSSVEEKLSFVERKDFSRDTFEVIKTVQSEMMRNAVDGKLTEERNDGDDGDGKLKVREHFEENCGKFVACAEKVLLKSDLQCLEEERENLMNDTEKSIDYSSETEEKEEDSVFEKLPDGSEIVRGTKKMFELPLDKSIFNYENLSILVGISAIITSTKYSIVSWTPETVDYVVGCGCIMSGIVKLKSSMDFYTYEEHHLPRIHVKEKFYSLKMVAIQNGMWVDLEKILKQTFKTLERFVIITTRGSFAVFSRKDFFYIYEYSTCNVVGFRIKNNGFGTTCFLRFPNLHSLVRRIYANHPDIHEQQKFLISQVIAAKTADSSELIDYVPFSESQEKEIIEQLRLNRMMRRDQMVAKMRAINEKICAEKERIKKYRDETGQNVMEGVNVDELADEQFDSTLIFNENDFKIDGRSFEEFKSSPPIFEEYKFDDLVGFQESEDGVLRIKGSLALSDKNSDEEIKSCHFACIFAIMYAVHHPVETMNYRSVDVIVENGKRIMNNVNLDDYKKTKTLKHMLVDTTSYELMTADFTPKKAKSGNENVKKSLMEFFKHEKYALISSKCFCLVIVKESDCFYIFDPYFENDEALPAAWVKLEDFEAVTIYLKSRNCPIPDDVSTIRIQSVKILSYKKIKPPKAGYFLFNSPPSPSPSNQKSCHVVESSEDEKIEWITSTKTIPWSRTVMRNAMNVERYLSASRWKEFDVEMDNKLYSLWSYIHPNMKIFKIHAGKQHLTCAVISLVMAHMYNIDEWDAILLDSIVAHGHKYYLESINKIQQQNYQLKVDDLRPNCSINNFVFDVEVKPIIYGKLYDEDRRSFNLNRALNYVFRHKNLPGVILQCNGKFLAVGSVNNRDFFMFDSQAHGPPLFSPNQGTSYVLKCCCLKVLLACIILTLDVKRHNVNFYLYAVNVKIADKEGKENYEREIAEMQSAANTAVNAPTIFIQSNSNSSVEREVGAAMAQSDATDVGVVTLSSDAKMIPHLTISDEDSSESSVPSTLGGTFSGKSLKSSSQLYPPGLFRASEHTDDDLLPNSTPDVSPPLISSSVPAVSITLATNQPPTTTEQSTSKTKTVMFSNKTSR